MRKPSIKLWTIVAATFFLQGSMLIERLGIPEKKLHPRIELTHGTETQINHDAWDRFLQQYTSVDSLGIVRVDYATVSDTDQTTLKDYIASLSQVDYRQYTRDAQLAYWVNLYNAITVNVVLEYYPVPSIRNITNGLFDFGPWNDDRFTLGDIDLSLHDIENAIVRPIWDTVPETHYLLNCAAAGCPNLGQQAYTAENIQQNLSAAARAFVNNPRGVYVNDEGKLILSKIYGWYREDFGDKPKALLAHIARYAALDLHPVLQQKISDHFYDWSLNDTANNDQLALPKPKTPSHQ